MRAGKLNSRMAFYRMPLDTRTPALIDTVWASLRVKQQGALPAQTGLRSGAALELRARQPLAVTAGDYALWKGRLFHLFDARDPDGKAAEWIFSAHELIGASATYTPAGGTAISTRAFVIHDSPYIAQFSQRIDYRTRIELPVFETGRAPPGGVATVGTVSYTLIGLADNGDDGVVRQYWGHT